MLDFYLGLLGALLSVDHQEKIFSLSSDDSYAIVRQIIGGRNVYLRNISRSLPPVPIPSYRLPPAVTAEAGVVVDVASGAVLWEKNSNTPRPIASLTKLMTAIVVANARPDFSEPVEIIVEDNTPHITNWLNVDAGEQVTRGDLLAASLMDSMNNAARALARSIGIPADQFVAQMNSTATELGMRSTTFTDVTGLDPGNVSTASDLTLLVSRAFTFSRIRDAVLRRSYVLSTVNTHRSIRIGTTNKLLGSPEFTFIGAKTGYLDEAGYTYAADVTQNKHELIVVLLGASTDQNRFQDARKLVDWAFTSERWLPIFTSVPK